MGTDDRQAMAENHKRSLKMGRAADTMTSKLSFSAIIRKHPVSWWLDQLSILAVMQYVVYRFLQSTMFSFVYTNKYKMITFGIVLLFGGMRFLYFAIQILRSKEDIRAKKKQLAHLLCIGCLAIPFVYVGWKHDYKFLIFLPLAAFCLYNIDAKLVLRWFSWLIGILLSATILCCLSGSVRNLVHYKGTYVFGAYGVINSTDFASYFTFLILFIWCARKDRDLAVDVFFILLNGFLGYYIYMLSHSKTALICALLTEIVMLWDCVSESVFHGKRIQKNGRKPKGTILSMAFPAVFVLLAGFVVLYSQNVSWAVKMNEVSTGRIASFFNAYLENGIHPFGAFIQMKHGNGGNVINRWVAEGGEYIDSGYAMLLIRYGWIVFIIVLLSLVKTAHTSAKHGNYRITLALAVIAFHAISEARFLDVNYNILLAMPFCNYTNTDNQQNIQRIPAARIKKTNGIKVCAALIISIGLYFSLPKILSMLRSIFYVEGWTKGIVTWKALFICLCIVLLLIGLWIALCALTSRNGRKKGTAFLFVIVLVFAGAFYTGDTLLNKRVSDLEDRLNDEKEAIELMKDSASQPLYVAELSELYNREFGKFDDHVFSTDELCRHASGSIITDASMEAYATLDAGGQYAQISQWSGIYSFDDELITTLTNKGYRWEPFYYSERKCNLKDLAAFNGLDIVEGECLLLEGEAHSLNQGEEIDQNTGIYNARFQLILPSGQSLNEDQELCVLRVMGESGELEIIDKVLTAKDFNEEGECDITIRYKVWPTPMVSYLITMMDDTQMLVKEISWWRES